MAKSGGGLCGSRKEAALSGIFSSMFYYAATAVVVYLVLTAMNHIAGAEVPLLAVVQFFVPKLSAVYSRLCRIFRGRHCKHRIREICRALHFTPFHMGKAFFRCRIYVGSGGFRDGGQLFPQCFPGERACFPGMQPCLRYASSSTCRLFLFLYFCIDRISVGLIGRFSPSDL